MSEPTRRERKYVFPAGLADPILAWLEHACVADAAHPASRVSSIYYDTPSLDRYREKRDGLYHKVKLRLRWYDGAKDPRVPCWLEIKVREGSLCRKTRRALTLESAVLEDLGSPALEALARVAPELGFACPGPHVPMALVRYSRRRFVEPGTGARISVDTDIRCDALNHDWCAGAVGVAVATGVLERKSAPADGASLGVLGPIVESLRATAFSKYVACMGRSMKGVVA